MLHLARMVDGLPDTLCVRTARAYVRTGVHFNRVRMLAPDPTRPDNGICAGDMIWESCVGAAQPHGGIVFASG